MSFRILRKTKIIATIGPASSSEKILKRLMLDGVNLFRINASHSSTETIIKWTRRVRKVARQIDHAGTVMLDLQGPRIRTGIFLNGNLLHLKSGEKISIHTGTRPKNSRCIMCAYHKFPDIVKNGGHILLDNGLIELKVIQKKHNEIVCRVVNSGILGENKGINIPGAASHAFGLTAKDREDVCTAQKCEIDYIALSFVHDASNILKLKKLMKKNGKEIPIIAKIEKKEALDNIDEILNSSDGIIVARGDLGIEIGIEKIPTVQKMLIREANKKEVPVIVATQMLESMMTQVRPTRAEVSDIANAIFDGSDIVMLSGETATGQYPVQSVKVMSNIVFEAERHMAESPFRLRRADVFAAGHEIMDVHAISLAGCQAAQSLKAKAIIVFTVSGKTARFVSKLLPECPIIVMATSDALLRRMALLRGVCAIKMNYFESTDEMIQKSGNLLMRKKVLKKGDTAVVVTGKQALPAARFMSKIYYIGEK